MSRESMLWHLKSQHGYEDENDQASFLITLTYSSIAQLDQFHKDEHKRWRNHRGNLGSQFIEPHYHEHPGMFEEEDIANEYKEDEDYVIDEQNGLKLVYFLDKEE